jgi:hypothetical protein
VKPENITELEDRRETYGRDERAINKHSVRVYRVSGVRRRGDMEFHLNRTLDGCPPFYNLYAHKDGSVPPTHLPVNGKQYWGGGLGWAEAERLAFRAIAVFVEKSTSNEPVQK